MPFGFGGTSSSKSSSSSSPGFGAGSMASARSADRSSVAGYSGGNASSSKSSTSSSKGSTATAAGRGSNAASSSSSKSGSTATGSKSSNSGGGDVGRFGGGSTGTTGKGFGGAVGSSVSNSIGGSMAAARSADRASVAGYAGRSASPTGDTGTTTRSTQTTSRLGSAGSMAAARAADRASVTGYAGPRGPSSIADARALDRASVPGYSATSPGTETTGSVTRGLGTGLTAPTADRFGALPSPTADRFGAPTATGLSATEPGVAVGPATPTGVALGQITAAPVGSLPDLATAPKAFVSWPAGKAKPTTDVQDRIAAAWADVLGAENVHITGVSGLRKGAGSRSHRHGPDVGTAMDYGVSVKDPKTGAFRSLDFGKVADKALAARVSEVGMAKFGLQGAGFGLGYMGDKSIHHDVFTDLSPQQTKQWAGAKVNAAAFNAARATYAEASKSPAPKASPQPVSSMIASAAEMTPQMAALNKASGVTSPTQTASVSRVTSQPASAASATAPARTAAQPASVATPAARPATTPTGQLAMQTPTKEQPYKRSLTGEVAATGIDLVSMSNPVGLAANVLSGLFLGTTVGGAAWDAAHGRWGENQYSPGSENQREGGGANTAQAQAAKEAASDSTTPSTPAEEFITKYIEFKDPTWQSPAIRFTSSVEPMVLTPPKYNFEPPTAPPLSYRRV